jgi:hypothetical protein
MKSFMKPLLALLVAAPVAMSVTTSFASTAANTAIINKAVLSYNGGTAESSVIVKVDLVPAAPNISITRGDAVYSGADTPTLPNTVTITSAANGPASYTVAGTVTGSNTTGPTVTGDDTVTIGATITSATGDTNYIIVPAPIGGGTAANSAVNGIAVNDVIAFAINGHSYVKTVTSTAYNLATNTFQIYWAVALPAADVLPAGWQVGEQAQVILTAKPGTITLLGNELTTTVTATVTATNFPTGTAVTSPANKWTSVPATIVFKKYSRNVSVPVAGTGAHANAAIEGNTGVGTKDYYDGGVTGKTGDIIEYVVEATNTGAPLTLCAISDSIPTSYVGDPLAVYSGSGNIFYMPTLTIPEPAKTFIAGVLPASNQASYVAANTPNLIVKVGSGANNTSLGTIGTGEKVTIAYQVKIK